MRSTLLENPEVQYLVHKSPPILRIMSQINPVHGPPTDFRLFIIQKTAFILLANTLPSRADEQSVACNCKYVRYCHCTVLQDVCQYGSKV